MDAASILARITDPTRPRMPGRTVLVFAHPDDETLACGALLPRLEDVRIVHVTDGAPRNGEDARGRGFATPADYAAARRNELRAAMALAGVADDRLTCLDVPDQGAAFALAEIARRLVPILDGADVVVTHAYEGGHPDHDAVCWAVHGALGLASGPRPALVEAPLYRLGPDGGWLRQSFAEGEGVAILRVTEAERELKQGMVAAHASQAPTLADFPIGDEPFRLAPARDFGSLPNGGALLYERYGWGLTGGQWLELAAEAARALRQERAA